MNTILTYLHQNWQRLQLNQFGSADGLTSVMLTPGFQASSHLIVFVLKNGSPTPFLVIKLPRLPEDTARLDAEFANLQKIHAAKIGGFASIPAVLAYEDWKDHRLLVETMAPGNIMRPPLLRRDTEACLQAALQWLVEVGETTALDCKKMPGWFDEIAEKRIRVLTENLRQPDEIAAIREMRTHFQPLEAAAIPLVFEHGDFSAPNLLIDDQNRLGVVDWELAEPHGLPTADLFFFLTYAAFAREKATSLKSQVTAFENAFFQPNGWAKKYILQYSDSLKLPEKRLKSLFLLSWTRYLANMISRLKGSDEQLSAETLQWLRRNRYYQIWKRTLQNPEKFIL